MATTPGDLVPDGDLAFAGATLYAASTNRPLVGHYSLYNVSTGTDLGEFHIGSPSGSIPFSLFGLAYDGSTMYAVANTEVYSVNLTNAEVTPLFDYSQHENGQALDLATGAAFLGPVQVPEPASLFGLGLAGLVCLRRKRR